MAPFYIFTPLTAAAITVWRSTVSFSTIGLRTSRYRWVALAAVAPVVLAYAALGLLLAAPGVSFDPETDLVPGLALPSGVPGLLAALGLVLVLGLIVNAILAFGEEVGWRGYLLWELAPLGFWRASLLVGAIWGLWHAPIIVEGYTTRPSPGRCRRDDVRNQHILFHTHVPGRPCALRDAGGLFLRFVY